MAMLSKGAVCGMNIAICDDELAYRQRIYDLVSSYGESNAWQVHTYSSGEELLKAFQTVRRFDIVFMDIEMKEINGVDTMRLLHQQNSAALVIFVTSHVHYVSDSLRFGGFQFMVKPITDDAFHSSFDWALETYRQRHTRYEIRWRDMHTLIDHGDILYLEAYNRHLFVHTIDTRYECVGKLSEETAKLQPHGFVRCHQGFLVNMEYIKSIDKSHIELRNGQRISMSRQMRNQVLQTFNLYLARRSV